ncbi:translation initiation factor eIF3 subunit g [Malassezia sp. CBS 17886]|nr:translation initiation factor eIF3 subunit g [Malassezia sp. CBS 17886]
MSAAATLTPENPRPVNWADDEGDEAAQASTPRVEVREEPNGIQVVVEYRTNADGKQVKVTRRIKRTLIHTRVNHDVAERKNLAKFGLEKGGAPGPNGGTTSVGANVLVKLSAGATKEPEPDPTEAMREKLANKRVQCRLCKGDHYTARCPYRDTLEAIPGAGGDTPDAEVASAALGGLPTDAAAVGAAVNPAARALGAGGLGGKYKPPSLRSGAVPSAPMGGPGTRDDYATLRVTNLSDDVEEEDLRELFRRYGRVTRIFVGRDRETGACKGFAYVNFEDRPSADLARQKLDGFPYSNLILSCQWSQPRGERPT